MFRFEDPKYLYLLAVVVLLALVRYLTYRNQKKRLRKFGDLELVRQLMPLVSRWRPSVKFWLLEGALALLIVMLARPQFGKSISQKQTTGIETIIAIDVSNSMRAVDKASDGELSRMERAKMIVGKLIDQFNNDKIGLVVFAGDAFIQLPITSDFVSAKMFLNSIDPSMIRNQGTDIAAAIRTSSMCFTQREHVGKAIIVITDGEDHEGEAVEAARLAHEEEGRNVYVLGIGSPKGALVPDPSGHGYMIDNTGEQVMSCLNEQMCSDVAQAGGGAYIHVENNATAQRQLEEALDKLEKAESTLYSDFDEQFQAVGIIVLLLLILEVIILDRQNPRLRKLLPAMKKKHVNTTFVLCLFSFFILQSTLFISPAGAQTKVNVKEMRRHVKRGNRMMQTGQRDKAYEQYRKAYEADSTSTLVNYNLGTSMFPDEWKIMKPDAKRDSVMETLFMRSADAHSEENPLRRSMSYHNIGVMHQIRANQSGDDQQKYQELQQAIEAYKQTLRNNPHDDEARYNLVLCQRQLPKGGGGGQQNQDGDQQQEQQKDEQQQQQQNQQQDQQQQPPQQQEQNQEWIEQMLNAAEQREKQTRRRLDEKQQNQNQRRSNEKNW